jgi:plastocyanin
MANHQDFNLELRQAVIPTDEALSGMEVAETVSPVIEEETSFWLKNVNPVIPETDPGTDPGDDEPETGTISIEPETLEFAAEGEAKEVTVTASGEYEIKSKPEWITGEIAENVVELTAANNTGNDRVGSVVLALKDEPAVIAVLVVFQLKAAEEPGTISIDPETVTFAAAGEAKFITVTASSDYEIGSVPEWITAGEPAEDGVTLTAEANAGEARTGNVTFHLETDDDVTATLAVTQLAGAE